MAGVALEMELYFGIDSYNRLIPKCYIMYVQDGEPTWVSAVLSHTMAVAVVAVDTGVSEAVACVNVREADIVLRILAALSKVDHTNSSYSTTTSHL